jgi:hypothetical protein
MPGVRSVRFGSRFDRGAGGGCRRQPVRRGEQCEKAAEADEVEAEIAEHEIEIGRYLEDLAAADAATDAADVAAEKARIKAAVEELQGVVERKRGALQATQAKSLVVGEPEAVVFGQQGSWQPSYNVQLSVDAEAQIVLDAEAVANPSDSGQLAPGAARVAAVLQVAPRGDGGEPAVKLLADAGYSSATDAVTCERLGLAPVFPVTRTVNPHGAYFDRTAFAYDADNDRLICPAGKELKPQATPQDGAIVYAARKTDCRACPLKPQCTKAEARHVTRLIDEAALERVSARLKAAPELMDKRAQSVEPAALLAPPPAPRHSAPHDTSCIRPAADRKCASPRAIVTRACVREA